MSDADDYLAAVPEPQRSTLETMRTMLAGLLPGAEQCISYGIPCFKVGGRGVAGLGYYANHCAYFPMSGSITTELSADLRDFVTSKGAIRFAPDAPLPEELVRRLVEARQEEIRRSGR